MLPPLPGLEIELQFNPVVRSSLLGVGGRSGEWTVPLGTVCVALRNDDPNDHDDLPSVYRSPDDSTSDYRFLAGETISSSHSRKNEKFKVAVLRERPGRIWFQIVQRLPGISLTESEIAIAQFEYFLTVQDPIQLLSIEPEWDQPTGQERLGKEITRSLRREIKSLLLEDIKLWSSPTIDEVSARILEQLDRKLPVWGLGVEKVAFAERRFPAQLSEVVLQFASAEIELLESPEDRKHYLFRKLGLSAVDEVELRNISEKDGIGAGLFSMAMKKSSRANSFIEWFGTKADYAMSVVKFLREVFSGKYDLREVELTEQVMLAAFKHPLLGLGEWGDTRRDSQRSDYMQLGAYVDEQMKPPAE
jgi:hypothetical protein